MSEAELPQILDSAIESVEAADGTLGGGNGVGEFNGACNFLL